MKNHKILIVEDELIAAEYLKEVLEKQGAIVLGIVDNGQEAIQKCLELKPDLVFMDIMLRDNISGCEAAVTISKKSDTKIIFLSAYTEPEMIDYAVEAKAIGYLTKPYNEAQIIANLRLALKETTPQKTTQSGTIELVNGYAFDTQKNRLFKNANEVDLGPKALKFISLLCTQPGVSVSNEQICMHIWGQMVDDRTLRSLIFRVRSSTDEELIKNVSGLGYKICLA
jgi:DNA-binding response OmpR family regulator